MTERQGPEVNEGPDSAQVENVDYSAPLADALAIILDHRSDDSANTCRIHNLVREMFRQTRGACPYPIYLIGQRILRTAIEEASRESGYRRLFEEFRHEPYLLAKILVRRDPDRFFDLFLVRWHLMPMLADYCRTDDDNLPVKPGGHGGRNWTPPGPRYENPRQPPEDILRSIRNNIQYLDEEDIFNRLIPFFRMTGEGERDGFERGFDRITELRESVQDPEMTARLDRVFNRFDELRKMEFGQFRPHLHRRNFPYMPVRDAIRKMEEAQNDPDGGRRFARFDTRTGKTSLALLEPEYLGKRKVLYICPPDTIPTILNEYNLYGGDPSAIKVIRNENDLQGLLKGNGAVRYCLISSGRLISEAQAIDDTRPELDDVEQEAEEVAGSQEQQDPHRETIEDLRGDVNPMILQLMRDWVPDYIAVDEARHFTGYRCELDIEGAKRANALLYILNNPETLARRPTIRLLDATPGDLPRHYYPLLTILHPHRYAMPVDVQEELGSQPQLLSALFSAKADTAAHFQVYDRPPVRTDGGGTMVEMGSAQNVLYEHAAHHSTRSILTRLNYAHMATFNPVLLRSHFQELLSEPMPAEQFTALFNPIYEQWQALPPEGRAPFDWDFIARSTSREFLVHLFAFGPEVFESCFSDEPAKVGALQQLSFADPMLSCKSRYVVRHIRNIVQQAGAGERHPRKIIVFSGFKRGVTREITPGIPDDIVEEIQSILASQIRQAVPEVAVYTLDGNLSTKARQDGMSARDAVREAWRQDDERISVLVAVDQATCQGVDLSAHGDQIEEIYMDVPLDSRLDYQIKSRTLGPRQDRTVSRQTLMAATFGNREHTIDWGRRDLVMAKRFFNDVMTDPEISIPPAFRNSIEDRLSFLGPFIVPENSEEEVVGESRDGIENVLDPKDPEETEK